MKRLPLTAALTLPGLGPLFTEVSPVRPAGGIEIGTLELPAGTHTQHYEVAAWYSVTEYPAQRVTLQVAGQGAHEPEYAYATVSGFRTQEYFPSLYGGVAVSGGLETTRKAETFGLRFPLSGLLALEAEGKAVLTDAGREHARWAAEMAAHWQAWRDFLREFDEAQGQLIHFARTLETPFAQPFSPRHQQELALAVAAEHFAAVEAWYLGTSRRFALKLYDLNQVRVGQGHHFDLHGEVWRGGNYWLSVQCGQEKHVPLLLVA